MNDYNNYDYNYNYEEPKKKDNKIGKVILSAVTFGLVAGIIIFAVSYFGHKYIPNGNNPSGNVINTAGNGNNFVPGNPETIQTGNSSKDKLDKQVIVTDVSSIVESCMPSVVIIDGTVTQMINQVFFQTQVESPVCGSGIIIGKNDTELLIVTNAHVVEGVNNLATTFIDGTKISAVVKGTKSTKDLAVIAVKLTDIQQSTMDSILIAEIGSSSEVKVGEAAIAIGNAMGYGQSVTVGVISALNREITVDGVTYTLIQTDAAINPGNSGGALINAYGQVIGINSCKLSDESVEGMGYAIPISDVMDIIEELMSKEIREMVEENDRGVLGINGMDITAQNSASWGYPEGIYIGKVKEGSAADEAGLEYRDVIVSFDGDKVSTLSELKSKLSYYRAGETVEVGYYRYINGKYELQSTMVTLTKSS